MEKGIWKGCFEYITGRQEYKVNTFIWDSEDEKKEVLPLSLFS